MAESAVSIRGWEPGLGGDLVTRLFNGCDGPDYITRILLLVGIIALAMSLHRLFL